MRKYTGTTKQVEILDPKDQQRIAGNLNSIGKTSARGLTDDERKRTLDTRDSK